MFSQYFGHYLLNRGLITPAQLYHALEAQQASHLKLGVLAMGAGFMTAAQVEEVHQEQTRRDQRFGEIAVGKAYLTPEQLDSLLNSQKKSHLLLGQALIDAGFLSLDQLAKALDQYKKDYSLTDEQFTAVQSGDIETLLQKTIDLGNLPEKDNLISYLSLFAKNMIRFIDPQAWLESSNEGEDSDGEWAVIQDIEGANPLKTAIIGSEKAFLKLASQFAGEEMNEMGELAQASVAEFLNLHNGIFLVNMSNQGVELQLKPQEVRKNSFEIAQDYQGISVHMLGEKISLIVSPMA